MSKGKKDYTSEFKKKAVELNYPILEDGR